MRKNVFLFNKKILVFAGCLLLLLSSVSCGNRDVDDPTVIYEIQASQRVLDMLATTVLTTKTFGDISGVRFHYKIINGIGTLAGSTNNIEVVTAGTNSGLLIVRVSLSNANQLIDSRDIALYVGGAWTTTGTAGFGTVARYQRIGVKADGTPFVVIQKRDTSVYSGKSYHLSPAWREMDGGSIGDSAHPFFSADIFTESTNIYLAYLNVSYNAANWRTMTGQVRRFVGGNWVVETPNFYSLTYPPSGRAPAINSIKVFKNRNNEICVLYRQGTKPVFKIYRSGVWTNYGSDPYVTSASVAAVDGTVDSNGVIYIAYIDRWANNKITVVRSTGSGWETVGKSSFSTAAAGLAIAVDSRGVPHVAYVDKENNNRLLVMYCKVALWQRLGGHISAGKAALPCFVFDNNGVALLAYKNVGYGGRVSVAKYFGDCWTHAGDALLSMGESHFLSLAVDRTRGIVYLAYRDDGYSGKTVVKQYK